MFTESGFTNPKPGQDGWWGVVGTANYDVYEIHLKITAHMGFPVKLVEYAIKHPEGEVVPDRVKEAVDAQLDQTARRLAAETFANERCKPFGAPDALLTLRFGQKSVTVRANAWLVPDIDREALVKAYLEDFEGYARDRLAPEHYMEVADVYRANPRNPTASVAEHFGYSYDAAREWVKEARRRKFLEPYHAKLSP